MKRGYEWSWMFLASALLLGAGGAAEAQMETRYSRADRLLASTNPT